MSFARLQTRTRHSSAFTLVELMIVIAIVGVLASLVTVGVMKGLEKGKQVAA
ncbi:MAG: type IV pilin protein, partial [Planctomycetia bacterium]